MAETRKIGYDTNLAAEFYALSMLHRLGFDATLTLGNKKAVDIVVVPRTGRPVTIDVKGLAGMTGWPVDNLRPGQHRHLVVFVCFLNRIEDPQAIPEVYVVPSKRVRGLTYKAPGGRRLVRLSKLRDKGYQYRDAWQLLRRTAI